MSPKLSAAIQSLLIALGSVLVAANVIPDSLNQSFVGVVPFIVGLVGGLTGVVLNHTSAGAPPS